MLHFLLPNLCRQLFFQFQQQRHQLCVLYQVACLIRVHCLKKCSDFLFQCSVLLPQLFDTFERLQVCHCLFLTWKITPVLVFFLDGRKNLFRIRFLLTQHLQHLFQAANICLDPGQDIVVRHGIVHDSCQVCRLVCQAHGSLGTPFQLCQKRPMVCRIGQRLVQFLQHLFCPLLPERHRAKKAVQFQQQFFQRLVIFLAKAVPQQLHFFLPFSVPAIQHGIGCFGGDQLCLCLVEDAESGSDSLLGQIVPDQIKTKGTDRTDMRILQTHLLLIEPLVFRLFLQLVVQRLVQTGAHLCRRIVGECYNDHPVSRDTVFWRFVLQNPQQTLYQNRSFSAARRRRNDQAAVSGCDCLTLLFCPCHQLFSSSASSSRISIIFFSCILLSPYGMRWRQSSELPQMLEKAQNLHGSSFGSSRGSASISP